MPLIRRWTNWLETHWVTPAYSGWLLLGFTIFFFIAATNTLAGWLYVLSGVGVALLAIAALLPRYTLRPLQVERRPIYPVSRGDHLTVEVVVHNPTRQPKVLLQLRDRVPARLGPAPVTAIELIPPGGHYRWIYYLSAERRGIFRWRLFELRTAAPLGLFWCQRSRQVKARAVVYPTVLPLTQCPLVDLMGQDIHLRLTSDRQAHAATEGLTRSLRPYRWGDPTRLIHWRTSARYGELRVRELEIFTGGQELCICLDSAAQWARDPADPTGVSPTFEQAVIAAASLYFYATQQGLFVKVWTAGTGLVLGNQPVLEALAATQPGETVQAEQLPAGPILWLTPNVASLGTLAAGSRWLLWPAIAAPQSTDAAVQQALWNRQVPGLTVQPDKPLMAQLQAPAPAMLS